MTTQDQTGQTAEPINYCPQCNSIYNLAKKFCGKCGIPLVAGTKTPADLDNTQVPSVRDSSEFDTPTEQPQSKSGTPSKSFIIPIVVVILIAIAGFIFGPQLMNKFKTGSNGQQITIRYINKEVTLRQGPGAKTQQVGTLGVNTQVAVIGSGTDSRGDLWNNVRVESGPLLGRVGYVKPKYLNGEASVQASTSAPAALAAPAMQPIEPTKNVSNSANQQASTALNAGFSEVETAVRSYYQAVQDKRVDDAVNMYCSQKRPGVKINLIRAVAKDTEYYAIDGIEIRQSDEQQADTLVRLRHKKYKRPEESWEINVTLLRENGIWKINGTPGRKI